MTRPLITLGSQGTLRIIIYQRTMEESSRELITRDKLNRQGIVNQNIAQVNQWKNIDREFKNKIIEAKSENKINLMQGVADAIAGERGFFDNIENNKRFRMNAFLEAIKSPYAIKALKSGEFREYAKEFGLSDSDLKNIGLNIK